MQRIGFASVVLALPALLGAQELPAEKQREKGPRRLTVEELDAQAAAAVERAPLGPIEVTNAPPGLDWIELGPRPIADEYWSGDANGAGRVAGIAVDPRDGNVAYLAAAGGGIWKTTDGGVNWTPLGDQLSSLASGALAIDPIQPDVVYYASGEQHYSSDSYYGDGVFRSTDGGATWAKIATRTTAGSYIARVAVHPRDSNILYLASSRGFLRSSDAGANWVLTLAPGGYCNDLVIDPESPDVVYAAIYARGIYKSLDQGVTWTLLAGGLPASGFQRINLAIAPSEGKRVYASFVSPTGALFGFFRTLDAGDSWNQLTGTPNYLGGQGWYDNTVVVDPSNANIVYAGGVFPYSGTSYGVIKSLDGGLTWFDVTFGSDGGQVHPDQHFLTFGPDGTLWLANDGGVWKTNDGAATWINCNGTLGITQFYTVAHHPSDPTWIVGGTQDNGTVRFAGGNAWPQVIGGDGGPAAFRTGTPDIFYSTYVFLDPTYSWHTSGAFLGEVTGPWGPANERADWCQGPLVSHPTQAATMFAGTYRIYRTTNGGASWATISGDLTGGSGALRSIAVAPGAGATPMYSASSNGRVHYAADAATWVLRSTGLPTSALPDIVLEPAKPDNAWVIADRSTSTRVFATTNAGLSWASVTGDLPSGVRPLSLAVDFRVAPPRLHVGTDYGVYTSTNAGAHWIKSSNDLPNVAVFDLALDATGNSLLAATHGRGMFRAHPDVVGPAVTVVSPNGGEQWPRGTLRTIEWIAADGAGVGAVDILLSTNGGTSYDVTLASGLPNNGAFAWTTPDSAFANCRVRVAAADAWANSGQDASDADFAITTTTSVASALQRFELFPTAPNPARDVVAIRYALPRASAVRIEVFDPAGRRVRALDRAEAAPGTHVSSWDGRDARGRRLPSGVYFVRLRAGDFVADRRVTLAR